MKPLFKKLIIITSVSLLIITIGYFLVFWYINVAWEIRHSGKIASIKEKVEIGLDYPANFSELIDTIRPSTRSMNSMYFEKIFCTLYGMNRYPRRDGAGYMYYSEEVLEILKRQTYTHQKWTNLFDEKMIFAIGLEKQLTPKEIESYYFTNRIASIKQENSTYIECKGIREVAKIKFNKPIEDLTISELIGIYVLFDAHTILYQENDEKYQDRVKMFERILDSYRTGYRKVLKY